MGKHELKKQALLQIINMKVFKIVLITLLVLIVVFFYVIFNYPKAEPETILIPENYRGEVIIVFDRKNGLPIEYEKKERIYRIPETGILFTQFSYNPGVIDQEYYFIDPNGKRTEIEYRPFMDDRDKYKDEPERVGIHKLLTEFYGTDSCKLKTLQYIVSSHRQFPKYSCYERMIEVVDTTCR